MCFIDVNHNVKMPFKNRKSSSFRNIYLYSAQGVILGQIKWRKIRSATILHPSSPFLKVWEKSGRRVGESGRRVEEEWQNSGRMEGAMVWRNCHYPVTILGTVCEKSKCN